MLGIDEVRFGRPRWVRDEQTGRWRTDPVGDRVRRSATGQGLLGQTTSTGGWPPGRPSSGAAIRVVALDPSAPYAHAVRQALPHAAIAVDHFHLFHLVALANQAVTRVRHREAQPAGPAGPYGRPGLGEPPAAAARPGAAPPRAVARMLNGAIDGDPSGELLAAWIAKEELRVLVATAARGRQRYDVGHRLFRFYAWCAEVDVPKVSTLAETVAALVAGDPGVPADRQHQCGHRGHQIDSSSR